MELPALHGAFFVRTHTAGCEGWLSGPNLVSTELRHPVDLPLNVLQQEQVDEPGDIPAGQSPTRSTRDDEVDVVRACDRRDHDIARPMFEDPHQHIPLFLIKVNHARSQVGGR